MMGCVVTLRVCLHSTSLTTYVSKSGIVSDSHSKDFGPGSAVL